MNDKDSKDGSQQDRASMLSHSLMSFVESASCLILAKGAGAAGKGMVLMIFEVKTTRCNLDIDTYMCVNNVRDSIFPTYEGYLRKAAHMAVQLARELQSRFIELTTWCEGRVESESESSERAL